ncbi:MAG: peptidoglycan-binding protein [Candidatus Ventricola sp.]
MQKNGRMTSCLTVLLVSLLLCSLAPCALARSYSLGDDAAEIATIQKALEELDFYYTDITGHYGKRTQSAVRKFQKRYRLEQTGVADEKTVALLYELSGMEAPAGSTALPQQSYGASTLREGSRSDAVRILQENLALLGYYEGSVTGRYGRLTKEAVRRFQRDNDLSADGVAGPRTFEKLNALLTDSGAEASSAVTPPGDQAAGGTGAVAPLYSIPKLDPERTLRRTSHSGYVTRLQKALIALGYYAGSADGYFGSGTEAAVKAYQQARGLNADGVAGRATLRKINSDAESGVTAATAAID